jgi:TPR repeat protein
MTHLAIVLAVLLALPADVEAMFRQAASYERAGHVASLRQAAGLYRQAAEQGHAPSLVRLGYLYQTGRGVAQDPAMAVECFSAAADVGDVEGQFFLALAYLSGSGIRANEKEARTWMAEVATKGHQRAQFVLGLMLREGTGGKKNPISAGRWFDRAARGADAELARQAAVLRDQIQAGANSRDEISPQAVLGAIVAVWVLASLAGSSNQDASQPPPPPPDWCFTSCMVAHNDALRCSAQCPRGR